MGGVVGGLLLRDLRRGACLRCVIELLGSSKINVGATVRPTARVSL